MKGKVAMVFAVIECMDTHGSDASITLRDKSGNVNLSARKPFPIACPWVF